MRDIGVKFAARILCFFTCGISVCCDFDEKVNFELVLGVLDEASVYLLFAVVNVGTGSICSLI